MAKYYTEEDVKNKLFEKFVYWMRGQTCSLDSETGKVSYYPWDADKFINAVDRISKGLAIYD